MILDFFYFNQHKINIKKFVKKNNKKKIKIFLKTNKNKKIFIFSQHFNINKKLSILIYFVFFLKNIIGLYKQFNGLFFFKKIIFGIFLGFFLKEFSFFFFKLFLLGLTINLKFLKIKIIISNIFQKNNKKKNYIISNGTYGTIIKKINNLKLVWILLPSQKIICLNYNYFCIIGRNNNIFFNYLNLKLAKNSKYFGKNIHVRGVAMNPNNHPHGGKTKTNCPEVSIWGWIAKHSH